MSGFDRLTGALQYQIHTTLGWRDLRPVQQLAIDAILDGDNCVVLAPTAGGKTEAAYFPLLSAMHDEDWRPISVVYLSPIRALLNNQEERIQYLAGLIGRRAFKWHGDVGQSPRRGFLNEPADIFLTTPESLEAMLLSSHVPTAELFAGLRAVVEAYPDHVILVPYPGLDRCIALTAWTRIEKMDQLDERQVRRFIEAYRGIDHHPR